MLDLKCPECGGNSFRRDYCEKKFKCNYCDREFFEEQRYWEEFYQKRIAQLEHQNTEMMKVLQQQILLDTAPKYICMKCSKDLVITKENERSDEE